MSAAASAAEAGQAPEAVWVDGREAGTVAALERGLHYGDGLFETIACVGGRARFLTLHLERLHLGCDRLGIPAPGSELAAELAHLAHGLPRAVVKVIVTRGPALARGYACTGAERASRILLRYAWREDDPGLATAGVRVRLARLRLGENPQLAGIKHLNRLEQVLARAEWRDPHIADALLFSSSGALVSGTMTNVFLVHGGRLCTPRVERCGVAGTMRRLVRALAAAAGHGGEECELGESELHASPEVFLTNALIGIRPIRELAGRALEVGALTRALQAQLAPLLERGVVPPELARA